MLSQRFIPYLSILLLVAGGLLSSFIDAAQQRPDDNRFTPVVLTPEGALDEPMVFEVLPNGSVYIIERKGAFKKYNPTTRAVEQIGTLPTYQESDQGLVGFTVDPHYATNHWVYFFYGHRTEPKMLLTRWELRNDKLINGTQKVLLEIPVERGDVSHMGGGMTWDTQGNLYLTTGNNSANVYVSQTDDRPGRLNYDDQRSSANTNDLRGKILRIHPEPNGQYSIPTGNLFPKGTPGTRPEIYIMGNRNPWRPSIDSKTGWLYWGEIGPDADVDSENGPRGYDELNQARKPGFFGWPYFIGENQAYPLMDFVANKPGPKKDPTQPINQSRNNTGLTELPPAQPAFIAYPYAISEKYPLVGSSSRCAVGGPVYHRADFKNPKRPFPAYYEGKWLAADLSRFWIMAISMDEKGDYKSMERFAPHYHPRQPIDLKFGPDGDLYVLEYGGSTQLSAKEARLVRIEYNAGNRKPVVQAAITIDRTKKQEGALPLTVSLSAAGSKDYDGDALAYQWTVTAPGISPKIVNTANPTLTLTKAGVYQATLTVTDAKGAKNSQSLRIVAGNESPAISINLQTNQDFFFPGKPIQYVIDVQDKEDGSLANGRIKPEQVAVSIDYVSEGFDLGDIGLGYQQVDASTQYAVARALMNKSDCNNCHHPTVKGIGPAYAQIATKYQSDTEALDRLTQKVLKGGAGVWSHDIAMPAHPTLSAADARTMVNYMLNSTSKRFSTLPTSGAYATTIPPYDKGQGKYILRAAYTDLGATLQGTKVPPQTTEQIIVLRAPRLLPTNADIIANGAVRDQLDEYTFLTAKPNAYIGFKNIDITGVRQIEFRPNWHLYNIYRGGFVEIRLDSPTGTLLGKTAIKEEQFNIKKMPGGMDQFWSRPPFDDKTAKTFTSTADITEARGKHDLYFVFTSNDATSQQALFPLAYIILKD